MTQPVKAIDTNPGSNAFVLKDQPDGRCEICRWNEAFKRTGGILCGCPQVHMTNPICINKCTMAVLQNIDWELARQNGDIDDGENWRNNDGG